MADPIKIRVQQHGDFADIRILMQHPMETGQRKDDKGQAVALQFIQTFIVELNGKPLIEGQLNTSISRNPLFAFRARGIRAGDKIAVNWTDNGGERRRDEVTVA